MAFTVVLRQPQWVAARRYHLPRYRSNLLGGEEQCCDVTFEPLGPPRPWVTQPGWRHPSHVIDPAGFKTAVEDINKGPKHTDTTSSTQDNPLTVFVPQQVKEGKYCASWSCCGPS